MLEMLPFQGISRATVLNHPRHSFSFDNLAEQQLGLVGIDWQAHWEMAVSYTHLTLPTILLV
eukprot:2435330-Pyramimonas_sp.AAC.1